MAETYLSQVGLGPLHLASQSPFQSLRLGLVQQAPSALERHQIEVRVTGSWVNQWSNGLERGTFFLDYETLAMTFGLTFGLTDRLQLAVELEERSRFSGSMDSLIVGFHDAFGLKQDGRDGLPNDSFRIRLAPDGGEPIVDLGPEASGSFNRTIALTLQQTLTCGCGRLPLISYAVTGRWGAGGEDFETRGAVDLGLSVAAARRWGRWHGYFTMGFSRSTRERLLGIDVRRSQQSMLGALEWHRWPRASLVLQWLRSQGSARDFGPFSKSSNEVSLGWKKELVRDGVLEIGIIENLVTFENSPDFGFHLGYAHRF